MEKIKLYFLANDTEELYELSFKKSEELKKLYPNWNKLNCDDDYKELNEVYNFFKDNGKLIAHPRLNNIFCGLTV